MENPRTYPVLKIIRKSHGNYLYPMIPMERLRTKDKTDKPCDPVLVRIWIELRKYLLNWKRVVKAVEFLLIGRHILNNNSWIHNMQS